MNPFGIPETCSHIAESELLFKPYRIYLNRGKYYIKVRNDDTIQRNQILFNFMQLTFNLMYELYLRERCPLIYAIMKDQMRKHSQAEIEGKRRKKARNKRKKGISKPAPKKSCF